MRRWLLIFISMEILLTLSPTSVWAQFRGEKEVRTINTDVYEVSVQKNGRTDIKSPDGSFFFDNAFPQVVHEKEGEYEPLPINGRFTIREEVNDRLGKGQGIVFSKKECEWHLRAYPTKPFFTVQVVYTNTQKKPVKIAKLAPWCVEADQKGKVALGAESKQTRILENGRIFRTFNDYADVVTEKSKSQWNLAAHNPISGRTLIAGFLTNQRGYTQIHMERSENAPKDGFDIFRAECVYDPPLTLAPGEKLVSELCYISVAETDPHLGLERYAKAMAVVNGVHDRRSLMPHGWDPWSTKYWCKIDEEKMLSNLEVVDKELKRYGWTHFSIDAGWERGLADWEANLETFPHGMKWMADQIHAKGMTAGIWTDPFSIPKDCTLAKEHPDWLVTPHALGRFIMGDNQYILDVTAPGAYEYIRNLYHKITQEWGYDALVEIDFIYYLLLGEEYYDKSLTRVEVFQRGMQAIREGAGPDTFIMSMTPQMITGVYSEGVRIGRDCAPIWQCGNIQKPWGCVETLTNASRRYYFCPHLYVPDQDCAFFGHEETCKRWNVTEEPELTASQSLAWLTGAILTGGVVKVGDPFVDMSQEQLDILKKLLPSPEKPARPIDLFQEGTARIWSLPLKTTAGEWNIVGIFNWDAQNPQQIPVPFSHLHLHPNQYYTVFDFWNEHYCGVAKDQLTVEVPAGSVRLLGLRARQEHPMLLASNRHFTQGAQDHTALTWDAATNTLQGKFKAVENTDYRLYILVPEGFSMKSATSSVGECTTTTKGNALCLAFHSTQSGNASWQVSF